MAWEWAALWGSSENIPRCTWGACLCRDLCNEIRISGKQKKTHRQDAQLWCFIHGCTSNAQCRREVSRCSLFVTNHRVYIKVALKTLRPSCTINRSHLEMLQSERTNIISVEKPSEQDHLKWLCGPTEEHDKCSGNGHNVVDQKNFLPANPKK